MKPLINIFVGTALAASLIQQSVSAEWTVDLSTGSEVSSSMKTDRIEEPAYEYVYGPGIGGGYFPDFDTKTYFLNSIHSYKSKYVAIEVAWGRNITSGIKANIGLRTELAINDVSYDLNHWLDFQGYNPFDPWGTTGNTVYLDGSGRLDTKSVTITPELFVRAEIKLNSKMSIGLAFGYGLSYSKYDEYDFITPTNQLWPPVTETYFDKQFSDNTINTRRYRFAADFNYALSQHWTAKIGYDIILTEDIELHNTIKDITETYNTLSLPIQNQVTHRISIGAQYKL